MTNSEASKHDIRLGIDLGGTKTEIIALSRSGETLHRTRTATPQTDYDGILDTISELVAEAQAKLKLEPDTPVGMGIPGSESKKDQTIKNANTTCLIGRSFRNDLEQKLQRSVRLANDANCFALSEACDGAAQNASTVFGVILGTGVGGGLVVNQSVLNGINGIAGEWGHNTMPALKVADLPYLDCYCGREGCIETFLSGPGLETRATSKFAINASAKEIMENRSQSPNHQKLYAEYVDFLARGLASIINVFDPDVIVLGGGLSNVESLYEDVPRTWGQYVFSDRVDTQLLKNKHGDSSGVRGAAWLWP